MSFHSHHWEPSNGHARIYWGDDMGKFRIKSIEKIYIYSEKKHESILICRLSICESESKSES